MASTSNKNTPGDYAQEQKMNSRIGEYATYISSTQAYTNHLPGNGLLAGKIARSSLCSNYCDVESQLFGIGTTNLVKPHVQVHPQLRSISSLSVSDRLPVILPDPLIIEQDQRPRIQ